MPTKLFFGLDTEKQRRIFGAALQEFGRNSYGESSTNRIVRAAGIGKGSLFTYFEGKEELYFYVLDRVISDFSAELEEGLPSLPDDLLDRVLVYAELEFDWHLRHPSRYRLLKRAFIDDSSELSLRLKERYRLQGEGFFFRLFEGIGAEGLRWNLEKTLDILKWLLEGFNTDFIGRSDMSREITVLKEEYVKSLQIYLIMMKEGLYRS